MLPTLSEVWACQFSSWYPLFSKLPSRTKDGRSNVTIRSIVISPLPRVFLDYINNNDSLFVPSGTRTSSALLEHAHARRSRCDSDEWSSSTTSNDSDNDHGTRFKDTICSQTIHTEWIQLHRQIDMAIAQLGGACVPKFNWSTPRDAVWVNQGTLECRTAGDVYLLCKASDFITYDVHHALVDVVDRDDESTSHNSMPFVQLVLRKWCPNWYPNQEFRCFVRQGHLVAICPRHWETAAVASWDVTYRTMIRDVLLDFFDSVMQLVWETSAGSSLTVLSNYVYDVYMDRKQRVWLVDLNVWASRTDPIVFDWTELMTLALDDVPLFRVGGGDEDRSADSSSARSVVPIHAHPLTTYKAPIDILPMVDSHGDGFTATPSFADFMSKCRRPSSWTDQDSSSTDDEQ
jgi:D123